MLKKFVWVLLIFFLIYIVGFLLFSLPVTKWESEEKAIKHFKKYISDPIPATIYDIKYGHQTTGFINYYEGITQRRTPVMYFKYRDNFENYQFLTEWKIGSFGLYKPTALKTAIKKYEKAHLNLYIDSNAKKAVLILHGG